MTTKNDRNAGPEPDLKAPDTRTLTEEVLPDGKDAEGMLSHTPALGPALLVLAFLNAVFTLVWIYLPEGVLPFSKTSLIGYSVITISRLFLTLLVPVIFFTYWYRLPDRRILGTYPGVGAFLFSFLIGIPASVILVAAHNLMTRFFVIKGISFASPAFSFVTEDTSSESKILMYGVVFLIPILAQEIFFRGFLFSVWPRSQGTLVKITLSALLFALFMQYPEEFLLFFVLGLLLGYIRHSTDNILCPILTQISMVVTYCLFSRFLPWLDRAQIRSAADLDKVSLYTAVAVLTINLFTFLPVLSNFRRISRDTDSYTNDPDSGDTVPMKGTVGWSFVISLILLAVVWVILLGI